MNKQEYRSKKIRRVKEILDDPFSPDVIFRTQKLVMNFLSRWRETVGESIAEVTSPYRFSKGTLFVACYDQLTIAELPYLKEELLEKLKTISGEVDDMRFTLAKHPKAPAAQKTAASNHNLSEKETAWIKRVSGRISDAELREKLSGLLEARANASKQ